MGDGRKINISGGPGGKGGRRLFPSVKKERRDKLSSLHSIQQKPYFETTDFTALISRPL